MTDAPATKYDFVPDAPDHRRSAKQTSPADKDRRSEARRDRDRVFYAGEFARLEAVTQVATLASFAMHNRLTHSYRVEQVARSIAVKLKSLAYDVDEDVVMAASLSHDIGHPPFGHTGEVALQQLLLCTQHQSMITDFAGRGIRRPNATVTSPSCTNTPPCLLTDSFEGNAQTLRVLARLGAKWVSEDPLGVQESHYGLDLTRRTLAASAKYPWTRGANESKPKKWGAYDCDEQILVWVQGERDLLTSPLEAQVMDRADDIAYAVHDLEDFYKSHAIPLSEVKLGTVTFVKILDYIRGEADGIGNQDLLKLESEYKAYSEFLADNPKESGWTAPIDATDYPVLAYVQDNLLYFPDTRYSDDVEGRRTLARFRSRMITSFINDLNVTADGGSLRYESEPVAIFIEFLKQLTWYYVIDDPDLAMVRAGQARVVAQCFNELYAQAKALWVGDDDSMELHAPTPHDVKSLPPRLVQYVQIGKADRGRYIAREVVARAVVDYICSLTDAETYALAAQLSGSASHALPLGLGR